MGNKRGAEPDEAGMVGPSKAAAGLVVVQVEKPTYDALFIITFKRRADCRVAKWGSTSKGQDCSQWLIISRCLEAKFRTLFHHYLSWRC